MATRPVHLDLVTTEKHVADSLAAFHADGAPVKLRQYLAIHTTYWVYDRQSDAFGPSKFVGFQDMDFRKYAEARKGNWIGPKYAFNGGRTRHAIAKAIDQSYESDDSLAAKLSKWIASEFGDDALSRVGKVKWTFVALRGGGSRNPSGTRASASDDPASLTLRSRAAVIGDLDTTAVHRGATSASTYEQQQRRVQNGIKASLAQQYNGRAVVRLEENFVDAVVELGTRAWVVEVKTDRTARESIRSAIGQLLDYTDRWIASGRPEPILVVVGLVKLDAQADTFLRWLNSRLNLRLYYVAFDGTGRFELP